MVTCRVQGAPHLTESGPHLTESDCLMKTQSSLRRRIREVEITQYQWPAKSPTG